MKWTEPLKVLELLSAIGAVTCAEARVYSWLLREVWSARAFGGKWPRGLRAEFIGNSLAVHWSGNPASKRRVVVVAHTDREGYVATKAEKQGRRWLIEAANPNQQEVEAAREGMPVIVEIGVETPNHAFEGTIIGRGAGSEGQGKQAGSVLIEVGEVPASAESVLRGTISQQVGLVTAHHVFRPVGSELRSGVDGTFHSWGLDNAMGVAVATSTLRAEVEEAAKRNMSVLYTYGEEGGFAGILEVATDDRSWLMSEPRELFWVVVDVSMAEHGRIIPFDQWVGMRGNGEANADLLGRIRRAGPPSSIQSAVIRLEDKLSIFDRAGARALLQAALGVRARVHGRDPATETGSSCDETWDGVNTSTFGATGVFLGGVCEASVLCHVSDLRKRLELPPRPSDRIGSIVMPILNYRHLRDDKILPEIGHVGALNSARYMVQSLGATHEFHEYPSSGPSGYRGLGEGRELFGERAPVDRERLMDIWLRRVIERRAGGYSVLNDWVRRTGSTMAARIGN